MTENPQQGDFPPNRDAAAPPEDLSQQTPAAARPVYPQRQPSAGQDEAGHHRPQSPDPQSPDPQSPDPQSPETQSRETQSPEAEQLDAPATASEQQPRPDGTAGPSAHASAPGGPGPHGQSYPTPYGFNHNYANNPAHAPKRKAAFGVPTLVASILAAGLVGGGVVAAGSQFLDRPAAPVIGTSAAQAGPVIVNNRDDVNAITAAALKASPSVVTIKASSGGEGGTGSGIILDAEGHVLTNTHVVTLDGKAARAAVEVRTSDGKVYSATIVGTDPLSDLAVIKINNGSGLVPATLGDSGKLNVGDTAVAIGSPLGLTGTVTDGIVSTLNRTISVASSAAPKDSPDNSQGGDQFRFAPPGGGQDPSTANQGSISINVIQTDAAINPGNSGGALVNTKGEVIGVNVAIASAGGDSGSSGNIGVGFSIPINHAKRVAQEIISTGKATHGQLGVSVKSKAAGNASSAFSIGAEVATVEPGSAADKAGIKVGDVVTKFQDLIINDPNQLTAAVREQPAGGTVRMTVLRGGEPKELGVTLGAAAEQ